MVTINNVTKLMESRFWKRKRQTAAGVTTQHPQPHPRSSSAVKSFKTDRTLDHSLLSDESTHPPSTNEDHSTPESLHQGYFRQGQHQPNTHRHHMYHHPSDCDNSSLTSHDVDKTSPKIPQVVSGFDDHHLHRPTRDVVSHQLRDTILGKAPITELFEQPEADTLRHDYYPEETKSRSTFVMTQASTQVATNRAIDLALRRIQHMQVQLQKEHDRLDALVAKESVSAQAKKALRQKESNSLPPYHLRNGKEYLDASNVGIGEDDSLSEQESKEDARGKSNVIRPRESGRLGTHVQRMQAKFLPKHLEAHQSQSISSSIGPQINLNHLGVVKKRFLQSHGTSGHFRSTIDENPFRNQLLLPALTSPLPTRRFENKKYAASATPVMQSPPAIQRFVSRNGHASTSMPSDVTPDPVFCPSPGTSRDSTFMPTDGCAAQTPAPRYATSADGLPTNMLSPDSIFASTFNSSVQSTVASDRATFMLGGETVLGNENQACESQGQVLQEDPSPVPSSVSVQHSVEAQTREKASLTSKRSDRLNRLSVTQDSKESKWTGIDNPRIDIKSLTLNFESKTPRGSFKEVDDDVSVKSLKEVYEAPVKCEPSKVKLMREKFETRRRFTESSEQLKQTVSMYDTQASLRRSTGMTRPQTVKSSMDADQTGDENFSKAVKIVIEGNSSEKPADEPVNSRTSIKDRIRIFEAAGQGPQPVSLESSKSWNKRIAGNSLVTDELQSSRSWSVSQPVSSRETRNSDIRAKTHNTVSTVTEADRTDKSISVAPDSSNGLYNPQRSGIEVYRESLSKSRKEANDRKLGARGTNRLRFEQNARASDEYELDTVADLVQNDRNTANGSELISHLELTRELDLGAPMTPWWLAPKKVEGIMAAEQPVLGEGDKSQSVGLMKSATVIALGQGASDTSSSEVMHFTGGFRRLLPSDSLPGQCDMLGSEDGLPYGFVKPTPMKIEHPTNLLPCGAMANRTPFRPISTTLSDTSMARFSHSSLAVSESLLKFSRKARLAAMTSKQNQNTPNEAKDPVQDIGSGQDGQVTASESLIHVVGAPEQSRDAPAVNVANNNAKTQGGSAFRRNEESSRQELLSLPEDTADVKDSASTDGKSCGDSSDGVTLDLSFADVSILTTPTALVSKAEDKRAVELDEASSDSSSQEAHADSDDESSTQLSEAAVPLLTDNTQKVPMSDDHSAGSNSFFAKRAERANSWLAAPGNKTERSEIKATRTVFESLQSPDGDWDVSRLESFFPPSEAGKSNDDDIFEFDAGWQSSSKSGARRRAMLRKGSQQDRATTPTRSNKSVRLIPTTRQYTHYGPLRPAQHGNHYQETREETQARRRVSIPSAGVPAQLSERNADIAQSRSDPTATGFPLSRQLREQAVRTSQSSMTLSQLPNRTLSSAKEHVPTRSEGSSAASRFSEEHSRLLTRIQRLREARIKRGVTSYESKALKKSYETDEMSASRSTQSSTNFGGRAFISSLDLD